MLSYIFADLQIYQFLTVQQKSGEALILPSLSTSWPDLLNVKNVTQAIFQMEKNLHQLVNFVIYILTNFSNF